MKSVILSLMAILFTATVGLAQKSFDQVSVDYDSFRKVTSYVGPQYDVSQNTAAIIRAWKQDGEKSRRYQVYVLSTYTGDWRFYNQAYDSDGRKLEIIHISQKPSNCSRYGCLLEEHVGLTVDEGYLRRAANSGIKVKIYGQAGNTEVAIPGSYVAHFLAAIK